MFTFGECPQKGTGSLKSRMAARCNGAAKVESAVQA